MPSGSAQALAPVHRGGGEPGHPHCLLPPSPDKRLTRLLLNVTLDRSLWPVHVVLGADATVADLVRAAVHAYEREGRRPPLPRDAAAAFDLHFSKYSLQIVDGSRSEPRGEGDGSGVTQLLPLREATCCCRRLRLIDSSGAETPHA